MNFGPIKSKGGGGSNPLAMMMNKGNDKPAENPMAALFGGGASKPV